MSGKKEMKKYRSKSCKKQSFKIKNGYGTRSKSVIYNHSKKLDVDHHPEDIKKFLKYNFPSFVKNQALNKESILLDDPLHEKN